MKLTTLLLICLLALSACEPIGPAAPASPPPAAPTQALTPTVSVPSAPSTTPQASPPTGQTGPTSVAPQTTTAPAPLPSTPATGSPTTTPAGWQTYLARPWQVEIAYPGDWTVSQAGEAVEFRGPGGQAIALSRVDTGSLTAEQYLGNADMPNVRCRPGTTAAGLALRTCLDTIARSQIAYITVQPVAGGAPELMALTTGLRTNEPAVFGQMIDSVRPAPRTE
jgi:hypothetical protein